MTFGLSNSVAGTGSATSKAVTLTINAGDVVVVDAQLNGGPQISCTATGLTFNHRVETNNGSGGFFDRWSAVAASTLGATTITVTQTSSNFIGIKAFTVSGANTSAPFDSGGPQSKTGNGAASDPIPITTVNPVTMIIAGWRLNNTASPTAGTIGGVTATAIAALASSFQLAEFLIVSSAGTYSCTIGTGVGDSNGGVVDAIVAATATGPIEGWRNNSVDQVPSKSQTWLQHSPPSQILLPSTVPPKIGGMPWFEPPDFYNPPRRFTVEAPSALDLIPSTQPPKIGGIGWFEPPDRTFLGRPITVESPIAATEFPSSLSRITGVGWFEPPDRDVPVRRVTVESVPAIDLIALTVPPQIAGMAWFEPPDVYNPPRRPVVESVGSWTPQVFSTGPLLTITLDTASSATNGGSGTTLNLPATASPGDFIIVDIQSNGGPILSVTATGLSFSLHAIADSNVTHDIERWSAVASGAFSGNILITQTTSAFLGATATSWIGVNTSAPWDVGGPIAQQGSPADPVNFTTNNLNAVIVADFRMASVSSPLPGPGFTQAGALAGNFQCVEYQTIASPSTVSVTLDIPSGSATNSNGSIVDALVPGTALSTIAGMAWWVLPDRDAPARKSIPETMPAWVSQSIIAPGAAVSGMAWFSPLDELPRKLRLFPDVPPLPILTPMVVNWEFFSTDTVWLADPPIPVPLAFIPPAPPSPTVGISGIGWFNPPDRDPPVRRPTTEQPWTGGIVLGTLSAPPFGWFVYPDRDKPLWRSTVEQPWSGVLIPSTLPIVVSGIGWFNPADRDAPMRRPTVESVAAWEPQFIFQVVPQISAVYNTMLLCVPGGMFSIPGDPPS